MKLAGVMAVAASAALCLLCAPPFDFWPAAPLCCFTSSDTGRTVKLSRRQVKGRPAAISPRPGALRAFPVPEL